MGQKSDPVGLRLGINRTWDSQWFSDKNYAQFVEEDYKIRNFIKSSLISAGVDRVLISRAGAVPQISVSVARPGVVIGKKGAGIEALVKKIEKSLGIKCALNVIELRKSELCAQVVADDLAQQLERRVFYKRAMKKAIKNVMKVGAEGVRINCSGRLGGAEIARVEWYLEGRLPLHTLRSDIDFSCSTAKTSSGTCGIKVWIYKGDVLSPGEKKKLSVRDSETEHRKEG